MEIDLPLYSPGLSPICVPVDPTAALLPDFGPPAGCFRLPPCHSPIDVGQQHVSPSSPTICAEVKCEEADDDFLKDILDLPADSLSPSDSGCHTGPSTPAHNYDFLPLALSPPPSPLGQPKNDLEASNSSVSIEGGDDDHDEDGEDEDDEDNEEALELEITRGGQASVDASVTDYDLVTLSIKDLNARLRHLPRPRVLQLKHRRRTLKNRQYAHVCRLRRQKTQAELATESVGMARQIAGLRQQLDRVSRERDLYRDELRRLQGHLLRQHRGDPLQGFSDCERRPPPFAI